MNSPIRPSTSSVAFARTELPLGPSSAYGDSITLTPESLVAHFAMIVKDLDGKMRSLMDDQAKTTAKLEVLSALKRTLSQHKQLGAHDGAAKGEVLKQYLATARALPPGPERDAVLREMDAFRRTAVLGDTAPSPPATLDNYKEADIAREIRDVDQGDENQLNTVDPTEITERMGSIDGMATDLERGTQMGMMKIQQMLNERSERLTMLTGFLKSLHDTSMAAISKI